MDDFFPEGAVIRRVSSEPALMFGAGRALLLQLARMPLSRELFRTIATSKRTPFAVC